MFNMESYSSGSDSEFEADLEAERDFEAALQADLEFEVDLEAEREFEVDPEPEAELEPDTDVELEFTVDRDSESELEPVPGSAVKHTEIEGLKIRKATLDNTNDLCFSNNQVCWPLAALTENRADLFDCFHNDQAWQAVAYGQPAGGYKYCHPKYAEALEVR